jgi:hypothetical protein
VVLDEAGRLSCAQQEETKRRRDEGGPQIMGPQVSDIRLKEHVEQIGRTKHDLPLYRFHYKGGSEEYSGVMAQDVLKVMPEAVSVSVR